MGGRSIILARHGQTELNRLHIVQGSGVDPGLNSEGRRQARLLFEHLGSRVDAVVSSGLVRSDETVEPFIAAGLPHRVDTRLREICWGVHEGRVATEVSREEYAKLMASWEGGDLDARLEGGESAAEMAARLAEAWQALRRSEFPTVLACLHGRALRCLACIVDGRPVRHMNDYGHSNAGYYVVVEQEDGSWALAERNVTDHLERETLTP